MISAKLHEKVLKECAEQGRNIRVFLMNGFQIVGCPTGRVDDGSLEIEADGKKNWIFLHAISTLQEVKDQSKGASWMKVTEGMAVGHMR